jgi:hypothetical protein
MGPESVCSEAGVSWLEPHMSSLDPPAQRFTDQLVVFRDYLVVVLLILPATVIVASPWILFFAGRSRLFLRCYLIPYPFVLLGCAIFMALINSRELKARLGNWRAAPSQKELKKAA